VRGRGGSFGVLRRRVSPGVSRRLAVIGATTREFLHDLEHPVVLKARVSLCQLRVAVPQALGISWLFTSGGVGAIVCRRGAGGKVDVPVPIQPEDIPWRSPEWRAMRTMARSTSEGRAARRRFSSPSWCDEGAPAG
jgi:hypothetical protein